jgi:RHS repeat-associated protein
MFRYDVDGALVRNGRPWSDFGDVEFDGLVTWPEGGSTAVPIRFRIYAFGEEFAYRERTHVTPRTASFWSAPGFPLPEPPGWELLTALAGTGLLALALRARPLDGSWPPRTPRELASAALASGLVLVLIFPPLPARAGGAEAPTDVRRYLLNDAIGSTTTLVLDDGTASESLLAPFGKTVTSGAGERRFAGHRAMSGLHYMQARWQDPETGTFLSVDPVVPSVSDPQSYNAYAYARNNPVNLTDPNGMCVSIFQCGMAYPSHGFGAQVSTTTYSLTLKSKLGGEISAGSFTTVSINGQLIGGADGAVTAAQAAQAIGQTMTSSVSGLLSAVAAAAAGSSQGGSGRGVTGQILAGEAKTIWGTLFGVSYGIGKGLYDIGRGIIDTITKGDAHRIGTGVLDVAAAVTPRADSMTGWRWPGTPLNQGITPAAGTRLEGASSWHDGEWGNRHYGSASQFGWIERAWTGPGALPGPYGLAVTLVGTAGFGLAGSIQAAAGY